MAVCAPGGHVARRRAGISDYSSVTISLVRPSSPTVEAIVRAEYLAPEVAIYNHYDLGQTR